MKKAFPAPSFLIVLALAGLEVAYCDPCALYKWAAIVVSADTTYFDEH
jgi:hypothetical protein